MTALGTGDFKAAQVFPTNSGNVASGSLTSLAGVPWVPRDITLGQQSLGPIYDDGSGIPGAGGGGSAPAVPTTGQIWPRGNW